MKRADRREQIISAATEAFARSGFTATSLDEIAEEAGITRVVLYRHFDSKSDLYQSVLDKMCERLEAHIDEPVEGFTDESIDGLLRVASDSPAGFRLLFQHALRETEFKERIEKFRNDVSEAAYLQIAPLVPDDALARWAAQAAPAAAIEATIAWLDAGQPDPAHVAARIRKVAIGVVEAALSTDDISLPGQPTSRRDQRDEQQHQDSGQDM
ncbi:TetR/AcrR family transcriptional regulator [Nocardioides sp. T2.26MG-1]|uniref:TetR/AcrR family transcriptional regulator n=1 Tax=Nocardioides sp. T2.26MG-1 TaxID=3041166 RepID=UPI0025419ECB|nr:TetR/AcrR family transcriptional regulator [Nocardioides sp. T2.26MG-1]